MLAAQHRGDDIARWQIRIDRSHMGPVHHHVGDGEFPQIQDTADHVAMFAFDAALLVMKRKGTSDLFMRRLGGFFFARLDPEQEQYAPHQPLHRRHDREQHTHHQAQRGRNRERETIRPRDGECLGQDFGKHQDCHGHHRRGDRNGARSHPRLQKLRRQGGGQDIDEGVAQKQGADQFLAIRDQAVNVARRPAAIFFQLMHPAPADRRERGLRTRKEGGDGK